MTTQTRRTFLERLLGLAAAFLAGALWTKPAEAGLFGGKKEGEDWLSIGKLTDLPDGRRTAGLSARVTERISTPPGTPRRARRGSPCPGTRSAS